MEVQPRPLCQRANNVHSDDCQEGGSVSLWRAELYGRMARGLDERNTAFLEGGETLQSLMLSELFDSRDGAVVPRLKN
uniref:Uncharacterized protein n=1 Tax=Oryza punctata TaxID=4537 RepID=A0A0E0L5P6_ORYPU